MKISELVTELSKIQQENGDIEVTTEYDKPIVKAEVFDGQPLPKVKPPIYPGPHVCLFDWN